MLTYPAFLRPVGSFVPSVESGKAERLIGWRGEERKKETINKSSRGRWMMDGIGLTISGLETGVVG